MEVVEQLDFLVTNAEVQELLRAVDGEAQDTSFKRPSIACETSKHVRVHSHPLAASCALRAAPHAPLVPVRPAYRDRRGRCSSTLAARRHATRPRQRWPRSWSASAPLRPWYVLSSSAAPGRPLPAAEARHAARGVLSAPRLP